MTSRQVDGTTRPTAMTLQAQRPTPIDCTVHEGVTPHTRPGKYALHINLNRTISKQRHIDTTMIKIAPWTKRDCMLTDSPALRRLGALITPRKGLEDSRALRKPRATGGLGDRWFRPRTRQRAMRARAPPGKRPEGEGGPSRRAVIRLWAVGAHPTR